MFFRRKPKIVKPEPIGDDTHDEGSRYPDLSDIGFATDEALKNILKNAVKIRAPSPKSASGTAMDSAAMNPLSMQTYGTVNERTLAYYIASSSFLGYFPCAIIAQHWLVSRGCSFKAKEAVKKWFTINTSDGSVLSPEQIKQIENQDKKYKLRENLIQALHFNNVFGIRHILFKHKNPDFDYSKPFNPDSFGRGEYAGMSQIDPYWITPEIADNNLTDPTSIGFYEPTYWIIGGRKYHKSHFVILTGDEVADYLKPSYRYGGISLVQRLYERVFAAESTANESPQLAKTKRLLVQKVDAAEVQANMKKFISNLNVFQKMRDNYGTRFIGLNDDISQIDTTLTDVDEIIMNQYQLVCAILGLPMSKVMGTGHNGFSTGETDDDYYIQEIEEVQGNDMSSIISAHYARLKPSYLIPSLSVQSNIEPQWNPIKILSENERADILTKISTAMVNLSSTGSIDYIDIQDFLVKQKDIGFEGLGNRTNELDGEREDE